MIVKMFASLKNKIREETGNDVTLKVNARRTPLRGRHSRQGSTSSLNSIVSADGIRESDTSPTQGKYDDVRCEEDLQKVLARKEAEFEKRSKEKEKEWKRQIDEADERRNALEKERDVLNSRVGELEESLKMAEEQKRKLSEYRDDKEQLENLQTQEISKVKQLLLVRERELAERTAAYKESADLVESLRAQVSRLRHNEQELSCVQENSGDQIKDLKDRVADSELRADEACGECRRATSSLEKEKQIGETLRCEIEELKNDLESERSRCTELYSSFDKERSEKDVTLLRNAQVSQEIEMARQRIACQDGELSDVQTRLSEIEATVTDKDTQLQISQRQVVELQGALSRLQEDIGEKEKNIKVLQQRLAIMKKTLQRELRSNESDETVSADSNTPAVLAPSSNRTKHVGGGGGNRVSTKDADDEDINFKYLKHVIIKFLTSREYEAKHLTRAVATLLKFSPEEEKLLQETLEWKMSWFGSRPKLGNGQLAMAIPPS